MTLFVGGPYHGQDIPIEPPLDVKIRLPEPSGLDAVLNKMTSDPNATIPQHWPYVYELDNAMGDDFYRCKQGPDQDE